jgi:hypothetical protein
MRFRLLRRRLTVSAPRMAVRSALPWPLRWILVAVVFGFCAAIGLWAFEFGKDIAGLDGGNKAELERVRRELATMRVELDKVRADRDQAQSIANTAGTLMTAEKAAQEQVQQQLRQLESENRSLRDDLGFFEKLIPAGASEGVAIRGLQADLQGEHALRWQVLVIQAKKNASEFSGRLELSFTGTLNGKPWTATLPDGPQSIKIKQYGRLEGLLQLPPQVQVKGLVARVLDGSTPVATQSVKL